MSGRETRARRDDGPGNGVPGAEVPGAESRPLRPPARAPGPAGSLHGARHGVERRPRHPAPRPRRHLVRRVRLPRPDQGDIVQFKQEKVVTAGVGKAGALIPPFEYHVLENAGDTPAITLHVYGGEMTHCHIFEPVENGWLRKYRELSYTA